VAAADAVREAGRHATEGSVGHSELLPDQGSLRVVDAVNGNIGMLINPGRGYQNLRYAPEGEWPREWQ
jgi:hypothetical protein